MSQACVTEFQCDGLKPLGVRCGRVDKFAKYPDEAWKDAKNRGWVQVIFDPDKAISVGGHLCPDCAHHQGLKPVDLFSPTPIEGTDIAYHGKDQKVSIKRRN